jgi:uroporphyrinogen decarboxylase
MDLGEFRTRYVGALTVMGGLDVQTTVGFGRFDVLRAEIERVLRMFCDGGLLFCTTHFVQAHCTIEELSFAFDTAYRLARAVCQ